MTQRSHSTPQHRDAAPRSKSKGARLGPSRMPRRKEGTDDAIGKGEEPVRPRGQQERSGGQ